MSAKAKDGGEAETKTETPSEVSPKGSGATEAPEGDASGSDEGAEPTKLSLRDALEVAVTGTKTEKELAAEQARGKKTGQFKEGSTDDTKPEAKGKAETVGGASSPAAATALQPPAEWDADAKADFFESSPKQQAAALRLHAGRQKAFADFRREQETLTPYKKIAEDLTPFLRAMGVDLSSPVAIQKALKMWREFEEDPTGETAAANYLEAKNNKKLAEYIRKNASTSGSDAAPVVDEKIKPLQERVDQLTNFVTQVQTENARNIMRALWSEFEGVKNAGGSPRFPDVVGNDEKVARMAAEIGSLVRGETELSKQFIASAQSRIPGLTPVRLVEEAYRYLGGRVDDSTKAPKPQATQQHIAQSKRAASSVPGGRSTVSGPKAGKKFKTTREAAAAALAEIAEAEGA